MDPRFVANPPDSEIHKSLAMWPELAGTRIRPLLVTAFGDIFVERDDGKVILFDTIELQCSEVASSTEEVEDKFADTDWADERLMPSVILKAEEQGKNRKPDQIYSIAPHPCTTGQILSEQLDAMNLSVWHLICTQMR